MDAPNFAKYYLSKTFADVKIIVSWTSTVRIRAHAIILAERSTFFEKVLNEKSAEYHNAYPKPKWTPTKINIDDEDPESIYLVLDYIYREKYAPIYHILTKMGSTPAYNCARHVEAHRLGQKYGVAGLVKEAETRLKADITKVDNFEDLLLVADFYYYEDPVAGQPIGISIASQAAQLGVSDGFGDAKQVMQADLKAVGVTLPPPPTSDS